MSSVSKNIKKLRLQKKLTQEEMADKLYVTRQTVSNWENGKSQPDIDTLVKISDTLNTDTTALIYGSPDSEDRKKDKKQLIIAGCILLAFGLIIYFFIRFAQEQFNTYFMTQPAILLGLLILPLFWLLVGWAGIQGLGLLGIVKPVRSKYSKIFRIAALAFVVFYAAFMLPVFIETIKSWVQLSQYIQNPALYPNGYHGQDLNIPEFITNIDWVLLDMVYRQPVLFVIPGIVFRLCRPVKRGN